MNIVDIILLLILFIAIYSGYRKGFILGLIELITWVGTLVLCFLLYPKVSVFMSRFVSSGLWSVLIAFLVTIVIVRLIAALLIDQFLHRIPTEYHEKPANRILGFVPGAVNGLVYAALASAIFLLLPFSQGLSTSAQESLFAQKFAEQFSKVEEKIVPSLGEEVRMRMNKLTVAPGSEKFIKLGFTVKNYKERPELEKEMLELINEERQKEGLRPLQADPELRHVAVKHSADMFERGYFSHYTPEEKDPFDRIRAAKVRFITAGENLALAQTLKLAHTGLMNSPGHRANILHKSFGRVGIGILDGGIYGLMVTQNFRN
ncbi:CvpA family protein [Pedobacter sp. SYSU D00535]|uniref:CvpA family protein n=1 Tax=Pedobacter sp. SYSU D00535 TaxID=2810308 RepID=UPI001A979A27|nr:CvpA family protein [Pedobacter sp. SYSU D00535]